MQRRGVLKAAPAFLLSALAREAGAANRPGFLVATFSILGDLCSNVGGDEVTVTTLVGADADVHEYQPKPADLRILAGATMLVENGLGLEGWMARLPAAAGFKGVRVIASAGVFPRSFKEHGARMTDPHAWQDPRNAVLYVRNVAAALAANRPENADGIRARRDAYIAEIEAADAFVWRTIGAVPAAKRRIITSHDAFGYFAARYGIEMRGVQGISTDSEPSARDLATLSLQIRRDRIRAIFVENMTDPRTAEALAREAGAVVGGRVYSDALSPPDGPAPTYLRMLRHNATLFAEAMGRN